MVRFSQHVSPVSTFRLKGAFCAFLSNECECWGVGSPTDDFRGVDDLPVHVKDFVRSYGRSRSRTLPIARPHKYCPHTVTQNKEGGIESITFSSFHSIDCFNSPICVRRTVGDSSDLCIRTREQVCSLKGHDLSVILIEMFCQQNSHF